jgi:hypothetical protein
MCGETRVFANSYQEPTRFVTTAELRTKRLAEAMAMQPGIEKKYYYSVLGLF